MMKHSKSLRRFSHDRAFTLIEIMVATVIMVILVGFFIQITSEVLKVWNRSTGKLAANAEARITMDLLTQDLESAVFRNNGMQWLRAEDSTLTGPGGFVSNTVALRLFSPALDRVSSSGGDICGIAYRLDYANPIDGSTSGAGAGSVDDRVFVLYRLLVDPDKTFDDLMGIGKQEQLPDKDATNWGEYSIKGNDGSNYLASNILGFEITFHVEDDGNPATSTLVSAADGTIYGGDDATVGPQAANENYQKPLAYAEITLRVISDAGMEQLQSIDLISQTGSANNQVETIIVQNSEIFTRRVNLPVRPL